MAGYRKGLALCFPKLAGYGKGLALCFPKLAGYRLRRALCFPKLAGYRMGLKLCFPTGADGQKKIPAKRLDGGNLRVVADGGMDYEGDSVSGAFRSKMERRM